MKNIFIFISSDFFGVATKAMVRLWTIFTFVSFFIPAILTFQLSLPGLLNTQTKFQKLPLFRPSSGVTALKCLSQHEFSRRQVVNGLILQIVAAPLIQPASAESYVIKAPEGRPRNVIITGANSGSLTAPYRVCKAFHFTNSQP
jgi:hypothetical protein